MSCAFKIYNAPGVRAKINAFKHEKIEAYKVDGKDWNSDWNQYFTEDRDEKYVSKYYSLVESLLIDIVSTDVRKLSKS